MNTETFSSILHSISLLTILIEAYVVYLVQCRSPKSMDEYKFFLNTFTIYDLLFTISLGVGLQPDSVPGQFGSWCRGLAHYFGPQAELFVLGLTIFFGSNMIISQVYCLTFRFTCIQSNPQLHRWFMSNYYKIGWFILAQTISILLGVGIVKICYTPEEFAVFIRSQSEEVRQLVGLDTFVMWVDINSRFSYIYMGLMLFSFAIGETICIVLIRLILSYLKQNSDVFSRNTYRLHIQLVALLACELCTPFILVLLPLSAALIAAFLGKFSTQLTGQMGFIVIEMYGITNALFTIGFVGPYRKYTYDTFIFPWFKYVMRLNPLRSQVAPAQSMTIVTVNGSNNHRLSQANYNAQSQVNPSYCNTLPLR